MIARLCTTRGRPGPTDESRGTATDYPNHNGRAANASPLVVHLSFGALFSLLGLAIVLANDRVQANEPLLVTVQVLLN